MFDIEWLNVNINKDKKAYKRLLTKTNALYFRYDPHTAYRSQAVGGSDQSHGHADGDGHTHADGHGQSDGEGQVPLRDDNWEEDGGGGGGGGGGGEGSKEHAHRMIANIYPSEYWPADFT